MAKVAKRYIEVEPFSIREIGFHEDRGMVSESLFSLSNEYHGIRGFFEEDYSGETLHGSYFNGIYEYSLKDTPSAYKGIVKRTHFMINSCNYLKTRIEVDGERLDLHVSNFSDFERSLDFKSGEYVRKFTWKTNRGGICMVFRRLLSIDDPHKAYQVIEMESDFDASVKLTLSLDTNVLHWGDHCYYEDGDKGCLDGKVYYIDASTPTTHQKVATFMRTNLGETPEMEVKDRELSLHFGIDLKKGQRKKIERYVVNLIDRHGTKSFLETNDAGAKEVSESFEAGYEAALKKNKAYWENFYATHDIEIPSDPKNQQGIRYCLFQLESTYHGYDGENNIGAKGLTGEAYSGHAFWDSETYCLTYYLLNNLDAARNLLLYRYNTMGKAKERARMLDCDGACFPIATLNGEESCNLWQHASLQFQPTSAVAFAIFHYYNLTGDISFIEDYGFEMLIEIAKFFATRGDFTPDGKGYGYFGVMGPDEFQLMVNHNTYTNFMAKKSFDLLLSFVGKIDNEKQRAIEEKCYIDSSFYAKIREMSDKMIILKDEKTHLFEQHDGYFKLPHIDVDKIPENEFPLYHSWSYDRIYRNDMIKQPDVLMFMFLHNQDFTYEEKKANYEFYEPRTIHESSLSPSIHSILAMELGKEEEALSFFGFATRLDLDDYNNNTREGLHTTSISAAWANIVYGFGGVRTDGKKLLINPHRPRTWDRYSFSLTYHGARIKVAVDPSGTTLTKLSGPSVSLILKDKEVVLEDSVHVE